MLYFMQNANKPNTVSNLIASEGQDYKLAIKNGANLLDKPGYFNPPTVQITT